MLFTWLMKRNWKVKYSAQDSKRSKREFRKPSLCQHSLWALEIIASLSFLERDRKAEVYNFLCIAISKCSSYIDHLARAHPRFLSMKQLRGSLISAGWVRDACPLQGYPPPLHHSPFPDSSLVPIYTPEWRGALWMLSILSKNTTLWPSQVLNMDLSTQSQGH